MSELKSNVQNIHKNTETSNNQISELESNVQDIKKRIDTLIDNLSSDMWNITDKIMGVIGEEVRWSENEFLVAELVN